MWDLTGGLVVGLAVGLAIAVPVAVWFIRGRRWLTWLVVLVSQVLAVVAVFGLVNRHYEFFASWDDLFGVPGQVGRLTEVAVKGARTQPVDRIPLSPDNPHPQGLLESITLPGTSSAYATGSVYLPAAYFEASQAHRTFPVVVMVAGMGMPGTKFATLLDAQTMNSQLIDSGKVSPFIALYVPGAITTGVDAECLDVQGSRQEAFLSSDVPTLLRTHFRVSPDHQRWFMSGWSTGGYCTALMVAKHPEVYAAGAALAPYYHPLLNNPAVVADSKATVEANDITRMVRTKQVRRLNLLNVMSTSDEQSWGPLDQSGNVPDGRSFHKAARTTPGVAFLLIKGGGHNFGTYLPQFGPSLTWLAGKGL